MTTPPARRGRARPTPAAPPPPRSPSPPPRPARTRRSRGPPAGRRRAPGFPAPPGAPAAPGRRGRGRGAFGVVLATRGGWRGRLSRAVGELRLAAPEGGFLALLGPREPLERDDAVLAGFD